MDWTKPLSAALVLLVVLLIAGSAVELAMTTLSIGPHVTASAVTMVFLALAVLLAIAAGARNRRWLKNPDSYW